MAVLREPNIDALIDYLKNSVFFIVSFWVLNQVAYFFAVQKGLSAFYPPSGFAMFLVYYLGPRYLPVHFLAILAGGLPQRDLLNYNIDMLVPDLRQFIIYAAAGLILRKVTKGGDVFQSGFLYSAIAASIVTAMLSSIFFNLDIDEPLSSYSLAWVASTSPFFVGNLTGAVFILPLFMLFVHARKTGMGRLKSDVLCEFFATDRMLALFFVFALAFTFVSLGGVSQGFSNYYYFLIIPMIWASVKWGLCPGLVYVFLGNLFAFFLYITYDQSGYTSLEGQVIFCVSVISSIFIGLAHKEKTTLYMQSMYDELTGLPNMRLFKDISHSMIASASRKGNSGALLFVDIDGFKPINDDLGHQAGDHLLRQIADRLKNCLRGSDIVARVGGDEFVIQLDDIKSNNGAETVALNVIDNVSRPFYCNGAMATVGASVGIAIYPQHGDDMETLIGKADEAMYSAKRSGKNVFRLAQT
ncbi:diguanylate cyclase domain-containing protein [Spiribacter vilamensis]|uniref:Diguanylate cyclase (GGDEF)-like protein n=1 Tax=Spiribacter vilamensis TaxID=531306 RepID=A0A4Q8D109_9GAMM|nr:diguanylate cyclase [Spiribacter vilamensis]RZU98910.1 diguanylate cyclase (GGDEF)-like protein [Spiribacter vilamensis]TVO62078.1 sensor domain-containing diguanylate cyclase [Spiribacter vilamensis]